MSSPRIRRRRRLSVAESVNQSKACVSPHENVKRTKHFNAENVPFSSIPKVRSSGVFDSGINDSDLQLAALELSWSQIPVENNNEHILCTSSPIHESSGPDNEVRPTGRPQVQSLKARIQSRIEANSRSLSRLRSSPEVSKRERELTDRADGNALLSGSAMILSLDTQQRDFVERRFLEQREEEEFFGLPRKVAELLKEHRGIRDVYDWQRECLELPGVREGRNLIYSLPTSGGKTLVAELLIMKQVLLHDKDALFVLPYVSIVQEKVADLTPFGLALDFLVEEYSGNRGKLPPTRRSKRKSVYIATIEKAHSIVNSLIREKRLDSLGLVVIDELHMIGEGGFRGAILEMTIVKVMAVSRSTRLVGMSATLSNISDLCEFMNAELFTSNFRPVTLKEYVKVEDIVYEVDNRPGLQVSERLIQNRVVNELYSKEMRRVDPDGIAGLVSEVIPQYSCLVFCPTKRQCENLADLLVSMMPKSLGLVRQEERMEMLRRLTTNTEGRLCPILRVTLPMGVAYHHSGLTSDERKEIEEGFASGILNLLCCTSTLAAGVNLPAKRVILRSPYLGDRFLSPSQYRQMIGRAGRTGLDCDGESIIILKNADLRNVSELLCSKLDACNSNLLNDDCRGLCAFILSLLTLEIASDFSSIHDNLLRSLLARQISSESLLKNLKDVLQVLLDSELVQQIVLTDGDSSVSSPKLRASVLGRASIQGAIDPSRSDRLLSDLRQAQNGLNMSSHFHLLYLVIPYDLAQSTRIDWSLLYHRMESMKCSELNLLSSLGLSESVVARKASGMNCRKKLDELTVSRVYLALILFDLWNQDSLWNVSERYSLPRGLIQQLLSSASAMASSLVHFVAEFEDLWGFQDILPNFARRLAHCANVELLPLMELPGVKRARAKQLFDAGFKSLGHVAHAEPGALVSAVEHLSRRAARQMVTAAKMLLAEQAETLMEEAQKALAVPPDLEASAVNAKSNGEPTVTGDLDDSDLFA